MSGEPEQASAHLVGQAMVNLVGAIPGVQKILGQPVVVGGLAVMCRLESAYRVTEDLDTLRRRAEGALSGLEILRTAGAKDIDEVGGMLATDRGDVRVDVLEARPGDLDRIFTDGTDRLEALAHQWTLATATKLEIVATASDVSRERGHRSQTIDETSAVALVACAGPLVAMKLKASVDRPRRKEATDIVDIVRLLTDPGTSRAVTTQFEHADAVLRDDVAKHADRVFKTNRLYSRRIVQELGIASMDGELIDAAGEFLDGLLR